MNTALSGQHLINGQWRADRAESFSASNPATGIVLSPAIAEATALEVDAALAAAQQAFRTLHDQPPGWTAGLLDEIASQIMSLGPQLLETAHQETALPEARLTGERGRTCNQLRLFAELVREGSWVDATIDTADPARTPAPKPDIRRMNRPLGPIVVFGASNFPFAFSTCGGDTASALAAGNPVVVKGHPGHPRTSELFARAVSEALQRCKLPAGLFGLLQGREKVVGEALVQHPLTQAVGFTGSLTAGRSLFNLAAARARPIPVFAEMGSLNPLLISAAAIAERGDAIARGLAASLVMGAGQFCTKPGLILIISPEEESAFAAALTAALATSGPMTMLNDSLRTQFHHRVTQFSQVPGVKTLLCGEPAGFAGTTTCLYQTTPKVWMLEPTLREEAFGPAGVIVHCKTIDQAIACLTMVEGSLTGSLHLAETEMNVAARLICELEAVVGRIIINGYPTGVEVCHAMVHGGPYPATTAPATTSVGTAAIRRFIRPVAYQDLPDALLPKALQDANPLGIDRTINGRRTREPILNPKEQTA